MRCLAPSKACWLLLCRSLFCILQRAITCICTPRPVSLAPAPGRCRRPRQPHSALSLCCGLRVVESLGLPGHGWQPAPGSCERQCSGTVLRRHSRRFVSQGWLAVFPAPLCCLSSVAVWSCAQWHSRVHTGGRVRGKGVRPLLTG